MLAVPEVGWRHDRSGGRAAWQARAYFGLKLPLGGIGLATAGITLGGLAGLTSPIWWGFAKLGPGVSIGGPRGILSGVSLLVPLGVVLLFAGPWLTRGITEVDRLLVRGLLGPGSPDSAALTERVRALEETRAHVVDDSAARLRSIERDLHDGAQAQLVALAMKLGLAKERPAAPRSTPRSSAGC